MNGIYNHYANLVIVEKQQRRVADGEGGRKSLWKPAFSRAGSQAKKIAKLANFFTARKRINIGETKKEKI